MSSPISNQLPESIVTARLPPIATKRLYQRISDVLRQSIDSGAFAIGSFLPPERDLAEQLGVSRTSVREALIALEVAGRVSVRVGAGVEVLQPPATQLKAETAEPQVGPLDLLDARLLIEPEIAALAARNATATDIARLETMRDQMSMEFRRDAKKHDADRAFHLDIAKISANAALELVDALLWDQRPTALQERFEAIFATPERFEATEREHDAILTAIKSRDPQAARMAMRRHLSRVRKTMARAIVGPAR